MSDYEIVVINEGLETRTSSKGKQRFSVRIEAEPIVHNFDKKTMGGPVAEAIAKRFKTRIAGISAVAKPATIKAREVAQRAFKAGKPWAMKKFSGGRTGPMEPNQSNRAFNDSGRFEKTITANASKDGAWRINVAANRLSGDPKSVQRIWTRLVELVPEFANPVLLMASADIRAALFVAQHNTIQKAKKTTGKVQTGIAKALFKTFQLSAELLGGG